jgi:cytochrome P450
MKIDGPNNGGILGDIRDYIRDPWAFVHECHQKYGHRVRLRMLHQRAYLISHADDIMAILQENPDAFAKGRTFKKLKLLLGEGLITSEGEGWKKQNRLMRPIFGLKHIMDLAPSIQEIIAHHCQWKSGDVINIHQSMNELTLKIIARTLFALDLSERAPTFLKDVEYMMHFLIKRVRTIAAPPMWMPLASHREFFAARKRFDDLVAGLLLERRKAGAVPARDLLQILMDARDEAGQPMSDQQIRDEIITILMAGHETITNSMAWTMILLTQNVDYQERLNAEAQTFRKDGQLQDTFNKINLHLAVLDEAMRIWPPVWAFMRQAAQDITIRDLELKKNDIVFLMPIFSQRSRDFWDRPNDFWPERFLPGNRESMKPGAYFPFGLGPRMCIGKMFAQVEAKLILSHLVSHYQFVATENAQQQVEAGITLRPLNNIHLRVTKR